MSKTTRIEKLRGVLVNLGPLPASDDVPVMRDAMIEMLDIMKGQIADTDDIEGRLDEVAIS